MLVLIACIQQVFSTELDCPESVCPIFLRGDGECDLDCMIPGCKFDSLSTSDSVYEMLISSDCYSACLDQGCLDFKLENTDCEGECNNQQCAWDAGQCGYCAQNCYEADLSLPACKDECKTIGCRFGLGTCGWCSENCFQGMETDNVCDEVCDGGTCTQVCENENCGYDNYVCSECSEGCSPDLLDNHVCDQVCANPDCNYDGIDCICGNDCTYTERTTATACLDKCNTADCNWHDGLCGGCANGCFDNMLGNGSCEEQCFTESCNYDNSDCSQPQSCGKSEDTRTCSSTCILPDCCNYSEGCSCDDLYQDCSDIKRFMGIAYHIISGDFTAVYDFDSMCSSQVDYCTIDDITDGFYKGCNYDTCGSAQCLYQLAGCSTGDGNEGCGPDCLRCITNDSLNLCLECNPNSINSFNSKGACSTTCDVGYQVLLIDFVSTEIENLNLCVPSIDTSTSESPKMLVVDPGYSSTAPLEEEEEEDPKRRLNEEDTFTSLSEAIAQTWNKYTTIKLRVEGDQDIVHVVSGALTTQQDSDRLSTVNLTIESDCTSCNSTDMAVIQFESTNVVFPSTLSSFTLKNVKIEGKKAINKDCTQELCEYCPYYIASQVSGVTSYYNDKNELIEDTSLYNIPTCPISDPQTPFNVNGYDLTIENCVFRDLRYNANSYISVTNGNLVIKNTDFRQMESKNGNDPSIIKHVCSDSSCDDSFSMEGGTVRYVNNGFNYVSQMQQNPFVFIDKIKTVTFQSVKFEYNIMLCDQDTSCNAFIRTKKVLFMNIVDCSFLNSVFSGPLLTFDQSESTFNTLVLNSSGVCEECDAENLKITGSTFSNTLSLTNFFEMIHPSLSAMISISGNTFENLLAQLDFFKISSSTVPTTQAISGGAVTYTINGSKSSITTQPKSSAIQENTLTSILCRNLINTSQIPNLVASILTITESDRKDLGTAIVEAYKAEDDIYLNSTISTVPTSYSQSTYFSLASTTNIEIESITFSDSSCASSPCFFSLSDVAGTVMFKSSSFSGNSLVGPNPGLLDIEGSTDSSLTLEAINISSMDISSGPGLIAIEAMPTITFKNIDISDINTGSSGVITISQAYSLTATDFQITDIESATGNGGAISVTMSNRAGQNTININGNSKFDNCQVSAKGGALYISADGGAESVLITMTDTTFIRNKASTGSIIYIADSVTIADSSTIDACTFQQNEAHTSGGIATFHISGILTISNSLFTQNTGRGNSILGTFGEIGTLLSLDTVRFISNEGHGTVYISSSLSESEVEFASCTFETNIDVAIIVTTATLKDTSSTFSQNNVVLNLQIDSIGVFTGTSFTNNNGNTIGSVCKISSTSSFTCNTCVFTDNSSGVNGGALTVETSSVANLTGCSFTSNNSDDKGSAINFNNNSVQSTISTTTFSKNQSTEGGTVNIVESSVTFNTVTFSENTSDHINAGITINSGDISITKGTFRDQTGSQGVYLYATTGSSLTVDDSTFRDGNSSDRGVITCSESTLTISNSEISNCQSNSDGSAISLYSGSTGTITDCTFTNNQSLDNTGHISCENSAIAMTGSTMTTMPTGGIDLENVESAQIINTVFSSGTRSQGVAIYGNIVDNLLIEGCSFSDLESTETGGAIYIRDSISSPLNSIKTSTFTSNSATEGGAIYLDGFSVDITSCTFVQNSASDSGGAIFSTCGSNGDCSVSISGNTFRQNTAAQNGGAIAWTVKKPSVSSSTHDSNSALYGSDIASFPIEIAEYSTSSSRRLEDSELASGQLISPPIVLALYDHYKQVVTTASGYAVQASVTGEQVSIAGTTRVDAASGIYNFSDLYVTAETNTFPSLSFASSELDQISSIDSDQPMVSTISFEFYSRVCQPGEYYFNYECIRCASGQYSLSPDNACEDCPTGAECYGGSDMAPEPHYWRMSNETDVFYECYNTAACLGGLMNSSGIFVPTGVCADGYRGNLCQPCENGYSVSSKNVCGKCLSNSVNSLRLVGFGILVLLVCFVMVRSSLRSAYQPKALHSIYIKIFVNYLQLVMLTAQFRLDWPDEVLELLQLQEQSGQATDQFISFDCFLETDDEESYKETFFTKLAIMAFLPLLLAGGAFLIWWIYSMVKNNKTVLKQELVTTLCVLFFLIHPTITRLMFSMYSCVEIEGENWLVDNLDIRCWDDKHTRNSIMIGVPSILIWVLGVPGVILFVLGRRKRFLKKTSEKLRFGFLYNGYRQETYYWEFVILYRKIAIICCAVFLNTISIPIQALVTFSVLMFCLHLQYTVKPFDRKELNQMEVRAIIVATITIYCGLYYLTNDLTSTGKYIFLGLIVFANVYFVCFWLYHLCYAGLLIATKFVPFLKDKVKDIEIVEKPLLSLIQTETDRFNLEALQEASKLESDSDFYLVILKNRMESMVQEEYHHESQQSLDDSFG